MAMTTCKLMYQNISGTNDLTTEAKSHLDALGINITNRPVVQWFKGKELSVVLWVDGPDSKITWAVTLFNFKIID